MSFSKIFPLSIGLLCAIALLCLGGCLSHSSAPERRTITPGTDIEIVDSFFTTSVTSSVSIVFRNAQKFRLPSFYMDYSLTCDNSYKKYASDYFSFSSNEQLTGSYYTGSDAKSCTFTITAIRPQYDDSYDNWVGSYPIAIK